MHMLPIRLATPVISPWSLTMPSIKSMICKSMAPSGAVWRIHIMCVCKSSCSKNGVRRRACSINAAFPGCMPCLVYTAVMHARKQQTCLEFITSISCVSPPPSFSLSLLSLSPLSAARMTVLSAASKRLARSDPMPPVAPKMTYTARNSCRAD